MTNAMTHEGQSRQGHVRRVTSPVRRSARAGSVPDVLVTLAFGGWGMAAVLVGASFVNESVTAGEAGPALARIFAGMVAFAALLVFLLGVAILRERQFLTVRLAFAFVVGALGGSIEAILLLELAGVWMLAPPILAVLVLRPIRERILTGAGLLPRGDGLR